MGLKPVKGFASFAYPRRARIPIPIPVADRSVISLLDPLIPNPKSFPPNDARAKFVVDVVFVEPSQIRGSDWDPMVLFLKEGEIASNLLTAQCRKRAVQCDVE